MNPLEQKIAELSQDFIQGLPQRLEEFMSHWEQYLASDNQKMLEPVHRGLHSLAGSSALYGCKELGELARKIEVSIFDFVNGDSTLLSDELKQLVNRNLNELAAMIHNNGQVTNGSQLSASGTDDEDFLFVMGGFNTHSSKILVVEDDSDTREYLKLVLSESGHEVVEADTGEQAIVQYLQAEPDIVLMDVIMPGMNGYEATSQIKEIAGSRFVPVIFLTSMTDDRMLARCIEAGGDDFLNKPFSRVIINSKIAAMQRIKALNRSLEEYQAANEEEIRQARHMFEAVLLRGGNWPPCVDAWAVAAGNFSGDTQLVFQADDSRIFVFQGDFTGHGLSPAVGTVLASEIFYRLASQGAKEEEILIEINNSLNTILPTGKYCATGFVSLDLDSEKCRVWNCGIPEIYCLDEEGVAIHVIPSNNMPLGILQRKPDDLSCETISFDNVASIVVYTDGITEAENISGELYGDEKLINSFQVNEEKSLIKRVKQALYDYTQGREQLDDISIMTIDLNQL